MSIYVPYSRRELISEPRVVFLGRHRVEFKAFGLAEYMYRTPVVILAGDFQQFASYREFVVALQKHFPVLVVCLPSLGCNEQRAPHLSIAKLADILHDFLDHFNLPKISLISMSLGGFVARRFSVSYPERVQRLVLAGIVDQPRKSFRLVLEESIRLLEQSDENFADATILHLFHPRFLGESAAEVGLPGETGSGASYRKLFKRQIKQLSENQKLRYMDNVQRMLVDKSALIYPQVEALVMAGEYDHFTLPFESAEFANACPRGQFALIKNADHLIQYERLSTVLECVEQFLEGRPLTEVAGLVVGEQALKNYLDKRTSPRVKPKKAGAWLCSEAGRFRQNVSVKDINYTGGILELPGRSVDLDVSARDLELYFLGIEMQFNVVVLDIKDRLVRFLFKHVDVDNAKEFVQALSNPLYFSLDNQLDNSVAAELSR